MYDIEVEKNELKYCALCHTAIDFRKFGQQKHEDDWYDKGTLLSYNMHTIRLFWNAEESEFYATGKGLK